MLKAENFLYLMERYKILKFKKQGKALGRINKNKSVPQHDNETEERQGKEVLKAIRKEKQEYLAKTKLD